MTTLMQVQLLLTLAGLAASIYALFVAHRMSDRSLFKRYNELLQLSQEQSTTLETHALAIRNLRARLTMRDGRAKKASAETNEEDSPQNAGTTEGDKDRWQREMNQKLAFRGFRNGGPQ